MPERKRLAVSVVVRRGNCFLLVERANDPGRGMFAFPGGRVEAGEQLYDAARRELFEETALVAGTLSAVATYELPGEGGGFSLHVFLATNIAGEVKAGDDASSAGWYSLEEMHAMPVPQSVLEVASAFSDTIAS